MLLHIFSFCNFFLSIHSFQSTYIRSLSLSLFPSTLPSPLPYKTPPYLSIVCLSPLTFHLLPIFSFLQLSSLHALLFLLSYNFFIHSSLFPLSFNILNISSLPLPFSIQFLPCFNHSFLFLFYSYIGNSIVLIPFNPFWFLHL